MGGREGERGRGRGVGLKTDEKTQEDQVHVITNNVYKHKHPCQGSRRGNEFTLHQSVNMHTMKP